MDTWKFRWWGTGAICRVTGFISERSRSEGPPRALESESSCATMFTLPLGGGPWAFQIWSFLNWAEVLWLCQLLHQARHESILELRQEKARWSMPSRISLLTFPILPRFVKNPDLVVIYDQICGLFPAFFLKNNHQRSLKIRISMK